MQTRIDIHDLPQRLDDVRALSGDHQIVLTDGNDPIARLLPLATNDAGGEMPSRLSNPFLGGFTAEDFQEAKQVLALRRPGHTTDEIIARLKAMELK